MKILLTADPEIPVPPILYGGIERIIDVLVNSYTTLGHEVTLFAHADSKVPCRLIPWKGAQSTGMRDTLINAAQLFAHTLKERYDVIHSFSRLAYLTALLPLNVPKIMSYQREPTLSQIKKATQLAKNNTLTFTGCSDYITNQIKSLAKAVTVYNCVPIEKYDFSDALPDDAPLMFLGRVEHIKGTHIAIEVANKANRQLIIAGNIPEGEQVYFDERVKPFLNDRIRYVGPINDKQKNGLLGQSVAFLMPIQWNEPFGIVMAEAMACGTPVIGFPFGSVPEVVRHGVTGYICKDVDDMVDKVATLLKIDRQNVRAEAELRFSSHAVADKYLELYADSIEKRAIAQA